MRALMMIAVVLAILCCGPAKADDADTLRIGGTQ